jgi:hypothetical protein
MSRFAKIVGGIAVALAVLFAGGVAWAAVATWQAGAIRVRIEDHRSGGTDLAFVLPAAALDAALAVVPESARAEIELDADAGRVLSLLHAVCGDLERQADFVLLEVEGHGETVRIEKRGGCLLVRVDAHEESVRLEIPLASIARVARWLGEPGTERGAAA